MDIIDILFRVVPVIVAAAVALAVSRHKTDAHGREIAELRSSKDTLQSLYAKLDKELAVVKSQATSHDSRLTEALGRIDRAIASSEERVIARVDFLLERLSDFKK